MAAARQGARGKSRKRTRSKKKAGKKALGPFDFMIAVDNGRVVIDGKNGGNIRARGQPWVEFRRDSATVPRYKILCNVFSFNDQAKGEPAWAFTGDPPVDWLTAKFRRKLVKPQKGASQLIFKYTIEVPGAVPADPAIIIEH
jgi:hypothetical protein